MSINESLGANEARNSTQVDGLTKVQTDVHDILSTPWKVSNRYESVETLIASWLWPAGKQMNRTRGDSALELLGYVRFYTGKNADLYIIPDKNPIQILMVRTDRTSVFNIPLDLEIEGKWAIQNQISIQGATFAERHGIKTAMRPLPSNIPTELKDRSQAIELCKQLEVEIGGKMEWMELIFRNYITGSLYKAYAKWKNPYETNLPEWLIEWSDIRDEYGNAHFTPTDKTKDDNPIPSHIVQTAYPEIVQSLQILFKQFTDFAYVRGYVLVDTKFEVFINSEWEWILGDEILTPESSRFILRKDFEAGIYISADKQFIRELGKKFLWEKKWNELKDQNPELTELKVSHEISQADKNIVLAWYKGIRDTLKTEFD